MFCSRVTDEIVSHSSDKRALDLVSLAYTRTRSVVSSGEMHAVHLSQAALSVPFCACSLHHVVFVDVTQALWFGELGDGTS